MKKSHFTFPNYRAVTSFVVILALLSVGFWLRFTHPDYYPIGFDQIQILEAAEHIQQNHFVLLGPRTGPAPMFTGPLIYYVAGGLSYFITTPYVLVATALVLFAATFGIFTVLLKKYLDDEVLSWLILALYSLSPYQVMLDRVPWNPNLTFLASALVFLPLFGKIGKKLTPFDFLCIFCGSFLGYQAHFSGFLLPLFVMVCTFIWFRKQWLVPLISFSGLAISLFPTVLFDLRHDFLNTRGFLFLLTQRGSGPQLDTPLWVRFYRDTLVTIENMGKVTFLTAPYPILMSIGLFIILVYLWKYCRGKSSFWWPIFWVLGLNVIFMFYRGSKPEYYFLLQFPALFFILAQILRPFFKNRVTSMIAIGGFGLYSIFSLTYQQRKPPSLSLGNQLAASQQARNFQERNSSILVYDMSNVESLGPRYLLRDLPSGSATSSVATTHLIYPYFHDSPVSYSYGEIAVWQDPRTDQTKNYLVRKEVIISSPKDMFLLEEHYKQEKYPAADTFYKIQKNDKTLAELFFIDSKQANQTYNLFMDSIENQWDKAQKKWQPFDLDGSAGYLRPATGTTLLVRFVNPDLTPNEELHVLSALEIL